MKKKIVGFVKRILTTAGKNWMKSMQYYSLQM